MLRHVYRRMETVATNMWLQDIFIQWEQGKWHWMMPDKILLLGNPITMSSSMVLLDECITVFHQEIIDIKSRILVVW